VSILFLTFNSEFRSLVIKPINNSTNNEGVPLSNRANDSPPYQGVNFLGYHTTIPETREYHKRIPDDYFDKSFSIISNAGMNIIRYLFTWESYEKNPSLFISELKEVSKYADKWGIRVIYSNDQFHISSWLDSRSGYGFPSFLFKSNENLPYDGGGASGNKTAKLWWTAWHDRNIRDMDGNDGWTLQADFLKQVVKVVDGHASTMGYEILNEPQVYNASDWEKIGNYNTYISGELRKLSSKTIIFDRQLPSDIGGPILAFPENMAKMAPNNTTNTIFKTTLFGVPFHCSFAEARLNTAARTAQLSSSPLWIGEFNVGITAADPIADINQTEINLFIDKFKETKAWGWSYWIWSFRQHPSNIKNYDLVSVTENSIKTTKYFDYFKNLISNEKDTAPSKDTICPTAPVVKINATQPGTDYSKSTPDEPVLINVNNNSISVEGQAYDTGSGIKLVQIRLKDSPYQNVNHESPGDWSKWSSSILATNAKEENELIIKVEDNADNIKYHTIFVKIVKGDNRK
jgi:hypothetical protein